MESGKHSALKQSSDGSFELVVEDDTLEADGTVSPDPLADTAASVNADHSGGIVKWVVIAAAVVALVGVAGFAVTSLGGDDEATDQDVAGFKPYTGNEESGDAVPARAAIRPVDPVKPSQPARRVVDEDEPELVESEVEMIEEVDPNWNVDENGDEIVESEEIPPDFIDQVSEIEEVGQIEAGRDGTQFANPKMLKNIRQQINRDIEIRKSLPNIKLNARPTQLNPVINPGNATGPTSADEITVIDEENYEEGDEVEE